MGIDISENKEDLLNLNYDLILNKIRAMLGSWQNRDLSLMGRMMIINTLVGSLFVYKMDVMPVIPQQKINPFHDVIIKYMWKNKRARIPFEVLNLPKNKEGIKLVNLQ